MKSRSEEFDTDIPVNSRRRSRSHRKRRKRFYSLKPTNGNHDNTTHRTISSSDRKDLQQLPFYNVHHKTYMRLVSYRPTSNSVERYPQNTRTVSSEITQHIEETKSKSESSHTLTINETRGRIANLLDVFKSKMRLNVVCVKCNQQAYDAESITANGKRFHMNCFKCDNCKAQLQRSIWNQYKDTFLCNPCHKKTVFDSFSR